MDPDAGNRVQNVDGLAVLIPQCHVLQLPVQFFYLLIEPAEELQENAHRRLDLLVLEAERLKPPDVLLSPTLTYSLRPPDTVEEQHRFNLVLRLRPVLHHLLPGSVHLPVGSLLRRRYVNAFEE